MKHKLIITGSLQAQCSCGGWTYMGILPEAKHALKEMFIYHLGVPPSALIPKKKKKKK